MIILILGLIVFFGAHAFTMMRGPRAAAIERFGLEGYKRLYSVVSLVGLVLIVWGFGAYRADGYIRVFEAPVWTRHLALLLMLPVFPLLAASGLPGLIKAKAKHPMLAAVKIWALSHLIANGDLGSLLLFAAFLAWAVVARISTKNRPEEIAKAGRAAAVAGWTANDTKAVVAGLAIYLLFVFWLHPLLIGVPVLPGR